MVIYYAVTILYLILPYAVCNMGDFRLSYNSVIYHIICVIWQYLMLYGNRYNIGYFDCFMVDNHIILLFTISVMLYGRYNWYSGTLLDNISTKN